MNRCRRCNREISNPNAVYGWRCAEILGVSETLSEMGQDTFDKFLDGVTKAHRLFGNGNLTDEQYKRIYSAFAKQSIWKGVDEKKVKEAKKESYPLISKDKSKISSLDDDLKEYKNYLDTASNVLTGTSLKIANNASSDINWFTDWVRTIYNAQYQTEMAKYKATDEAQKNFQRKFWQFGAQHLLREKWGYLTSAWMLEHSLQDNPSDIWRGNDSRIAYLINNDSEYLSKLDSAIKSSKNGKIDQDLEEVKFKTGDLYYSIHKSKIHVDGYLQSNGKWLVHAKMSDTYDFTEMQTFMDDNGGWSTQAGIGTVANDAAAVSQVLGAINPYKITVEFYTTR